MLLLSAHISAIYRFWWSIIHEQVVGHEKFLDAVSCNIIFNNDIKLFHSPAQSFCKDKREIYSEVKTIAWVLSAYLRTPRTRKNEATVWINNQFKLESYGLKYYRRINWCSMEKMVANMGGYYNSKTGQIIDEKYKMINEHSRRRWKLYIRLMLFYIQVFMYTLFVSAVLHTGWSFWIHGDRRSTAWVFFWQIVQWNLPSSVLQVYWRISWINNL